MLFYDADYELVLMLSTNQLVASWRQILAGNVDGLDSVNFCIATKSATKNDLLRFDNEAIVEGLIYCNNDFFVYDILAERSKALCSGRSLNWRRFESCRCHFSFAPRKSHTT